MAVHSVQPRHTAVPRSVPPNMLSLVITVTVLTHGLTLAASPAPKDCVDVVVPGNNSIEVKKFTAKEAKLLFFPDEDFTGVSITLDTTVGKKTKRVTRQGLCVDSSQWYSLEVKVGVQRKYRIVDVYYYWTYYNTNYCSDRFRSTFSSSGNFKSITVVAHGASFWSLNITNTTQCPTPVGAHTTPSSETFPVWLVGVAVAAVVLAVVVTVAYIARHRLQPYDSQRARLHPPTNTP